MSRDLYMYHIFFNELFPMHKALTDYTGRIIWKHWIETLAECCEEINSFVGMIPEYSAKLVEAICADAFRQARFSIEEVRRMLRAEVITKEYGSEAETGDQLQFDF